jgi:hypothetical protein
MMSLIGNVPDYPEKEHHMNEQSPSAFSSSGATSSTAAHGCNRHAHRRGGIWRKVFGFTLLFGVVAGAAYLGAGRAHRGMLAGHGMTFGAFDPATSATRIDAMVSHARADIDGTAAQKAKIGEVAKGALTDLMPLRASG